MLQHLWLNLLNSITDFFNLFSEGYNMEELIQKETMACAIFSVKSQISRDYHDFAIYWGWKEQW